MSTFLLFLGQTNQNMSDLENALDPVSEEAHLREIWRELGVGQSGYITMHELGTVCEHIGMDEMTNEVCGFNLGSFLSINLTSKWAFIRFLNLSINLA